MNDTTKPTMKALSIRAPWWWFILYAGKDIENRTWNCHKRGPIAIQASSWWSTKQVAKDFKDMVNLLKARGEWPCAEILTKGWVPPRDDGKLFTWRDLKDLGGYVVGTTEIVGCVQQSESPWFFGPNGIVLANTKPIIPFPHKGKLSFFDVPIGGVNQNINAEGCK